MERLAEMQQRLLVLVVVVLTATVLAACGGGPIDSAAETIDAAPVELEIASPAKSSTPAPYDELMDPEFGCAGGGSLEYGLVDRPDLD
jgi:hypothetical protein